MIIKFDQYEKIFKSLSENMGESELTSEELVNELDINKSEIDSQILFIKEGLLDDFKNSFSKWFFGSIGKVGKIDMYRNGILDAKKEFLDKTFVLEDEVDVLETQIRNTEGDIAELKSLETQLNNKKKQIDAIKKAIYLEISDYERKIEKSIGDNPRRLEYYEAKKSEDAVKIAQYELKLINEKTSPERVKELELKLKNAQDEARKKSEAFIRKMREEKEKGRVSDSNYSNSYKNIEMWLEKDRISKYKSVNTLLDVSNNFDSERFIDSIFKMRADLSDLRRKIERSEYDLRMKPDFYKENPVEKERLLKSLRMMRIDMDKLELLNEPFEQYIKAGKESTKKKSEDINKDKELAEIIKAFELLKKKAEEALKK